MDLKTHYLRACWSAAFICALTVNTAYGQVAQDCSVSKPEAALAYLKNDRTTLEPNCIARAIETLRDAQYKQAIDTLLQYLDFTPYAPGVPPVMDASQPTGRSYPAADALFSFGKSILPRTKQVIRDDGQSPMSRLNAARIYFGLEPGPEAIRFIVQASRDTSSAEAHTKLIEFAMKAARYCSDQQSQACEDALNG